MVALRTVPNSRVSALSRGIIAVVLIIILFITVGATYVFSNQQPTDLTVMATTSGAGSTISRTSTVAAAGTVVYVDIPNDLGYPYAQYTPQIITVVIGVNNTVTWTNHDTLVHNILTASGLFASGDLSPGSSYTFTFTQAGTYDYYCSYHPSMNGVVIVRNP